MATTHNYNRDGQPAPEATTTRLKRVSKGGNVDGVFCSGLGHLPSYPAAHQLVPPCYVDRERETHLALRR
jgi:hypothetical protein